MTSMYFKSEDPAKLAIFEAHHAARRAVHEKAKAFAAQFAKEGQTATCFYKQQSGGLHGVRFAPRMPDDMWTVPHGDADAQRPRATRKGKGLTAEQKAEQAALVAAWDAAWPKDDAPFDDMFRQLMGVDREWFGGSTKVFVQGGAIWVQSSCAPAAEAGMVEVLGSVFATAEQAGYAARKAAERDDRPGGW